MVRTPRGDRVAASTLLRRPDVRLQIDGRRRRRCARPGTVDACARRREPRERRQIRRLPADRRRRAPSACGGRSGVAFRTAFRSTAFPACLAKWSTGFRRSGPRRSARPRAYRASRRRRRRARRVPRKIARKPLTSREFQDRLSRRARRAGVTLAADLAEQLEAYYRLLATWNTKINLTGLEALRDLARRARSAADRTGGGGEVCAPARVAHARHRQRRRLAGDSARAGGSERAAADGGVEDAEVGIPARSGARARDERTPTLSRRGSRNCSRGRTCTRRTTS